MTQIDFAERFSRLVPFFYFYNLSPWKLRGSLQFVLSEDSFDWFRWLTDWMYSYWLPDDWLIVLSWQENGPTIVGDEHSDPGLMTALNADRVRQQGNNFDEWITEDIPRVVLQKLSVKGYRVVGMAGIGQTCAWTLYKADD